MSVQLNQYLGYGYILPYKDTMKALEAKYQESEIEALFDKYYDSAYKADIVEVNGFSFIVDGMSGKFCFFGKLFLKSKGYDPLPTTSMPEIPLSLQEDLVQEYHRVFGDFDSVTPNTALITLYR